MKRTDVNQILIELGFNPIKVEYLSFDPKGISVEAYVNGSADTVSYYLPYAKEPSVRVVPAGTTVINPASFPV